MQLNHPHHTTRTKDEQEQVIKVSFFTGDSVPRVPLYKKKFTNNHTRTRGQTTHQTLLFLFMIYFLRFPRIRKCVLGLIHTNAYK